MQAQAQLHAQKIDNRTNRNIRRLIYIPIFLYAIAMIIPFYWMMIGAFKPVSELAKTPPTFYVENPTLNNFYDPYYEGRDDSRTTDEHTEGLFQRFDSVEWGFARFYLNSVIVTVAVVFLVLMIASLTSYVLAKHDFPGRNFFFLLFIASMMLPWQVTLVPGYLLMRDFGWLNSFTALIVPALPKAYVVFFLRQYMMSIPSEMIEAAKVDGAGEWRIWLRIILPLARPALVAMGILLFIAEWNNLVWPLIVISPGENRTLPMAMASLNLTFNSAQTLGVLLAGSLLTSLPLLFIFLKFQNEFVSGITMGGVKG